ncbi:MAG: hypothetical protein J5I90_00450 [Caldilineales bacterium]|nr:hypothetical protein [Caldilineales bacterium]
MKTPKHLLYHVLLFLFAALLLAACVAPAAAPTPAPPAPEPTYAPIEDGAQPLLDWHREGGTAGFCDDVTIYSSGEVLFGSCTGNEPADIAETELDAADLATVLGWSESLQSFDHVTSDDATADGMTIGIQFTGSGDQAAGPADIALMSDFAHGLWYEMRLANQPRPDVCLPPAEGQRSLVDMLNAYCLLYSADYTPIQISPESTELVIGDLMNHIDPRVSITVEDADGRSLEDVAGEYLAAYTLPEGEFEIGYITVDGVDAIMLDNLPGQDLNRRVAFIQNGRLYSFMFAPLGDEGSATRPQAEALYQMTLDSFRFLDETMPEPLPRPEAADIVPADVQYIQAMVDVHIRSGPGTKYGIVGDVFAGQYALVTGMMPNGDWWRVICPDDTIGSCFVVNDLVLTEPANPPNAPASDTGEAVIEQIELVSTDDSSVTIALYGTLPDVCSQINNADATRAGATFYVQIAVSRQANARCAPQATPFVQEIELDMTGLPGGSYRVVTGEVTNTFYWEPSQT